MDMNLCKETIILLHVMFWFGLCCLMMPGSVRTFGVMYDHIFPKLANHQIQHQATHKVGCQPGVCVGMYGLTYWAGGGGRVIFR